MVNESSLKNTDKIFLREKIIQGSRNYNKYLKDKEFIVITENNEIYSIVFPIKNFSHLTGLATSLKPNEFFRNCLDGKIALSQINTEQKYNLKTLIKKAMLI